MDRDLFEKDHKIDPLQLDVECAQQCEVFFAWAEKAIEARHAFDVSETFVDLTEADLQLKMRKDPGKYGVPGDRITEAALAACVKVHPDYLRAVASMHALKRDSSMLDKAVVALEMKKRMLETLVTLHGQQYFAGPSTPRDLGAAWALQRKRGDENLNQKIMKMTKKKRKK